MTAPVTTGSMLHDAILDSERAPLRLLESRGPTEVAVQRMWIKIHARHVADPHAWKDGLAPWSRRSGWTGAEKTGPGRWLRQVRLIFRGTAGQRFVFALLAVTMLSLVVLRWRIPTPLKLADEQAIFAAESVITTDKGRSIAFAEGSSIELSPQSELSVLSNEGPTIVFALRSGRAHFFVTPGGPRRWTVDAGQLSVRVIGTAFIVDKRDGKTSVEVEKGIVAVTGAIPGGFVELRAGQRVESLSTSISSISARQGGKSRQEAAPETNAHEGSSAEESAPVVLVEKEETVFTLEDLEPCEDCDDEEKGEPPSHRPALGLTLAGLSVDELMTRADEERRAGRSGRAAIYLEHVVQSAPPDDSRRALAALSYARISAIPAKVAPVLIDTLDSMPAGLREPALARLVEALGKSGQTARAKSYAGIYLREFPSGLHASKVKGWAP